MKEILLFSARTLRSQGLRTYLTILGVIVGIASIVIFMSMGKSMEIAIESEFQKIGSDKIFLVPGSPNTLGFTGAAMASRRFGEKEIKELRKIPCVENVVGYYSTAVEVEYAGQRETLIAYGIPIDENLQLVKSMKAYQIVDGRDFRPSDRRVAVIGSKVANDIFSKKIRARSKILIEGQRFRVIGLMGPTGSPDDYAISIPMDDMKMFGFNDTYNFIIVDVKERCDVEKTREKVVDEMKKLRGKEDFKAQTSEGILSAFKSVLSLVRAIFIGVSAISLIVGGIGIMNTMLMSVIERTREIGVMKAIGATKRNILTIFLAESAAIGLAGGLIGITFGLLASFGLSLIINQYLVLDYPFTVPVEGILIALAFSVAVGILSGIYPAMRAASLDPVEALRWE